MSKKILMVDDDPEQLRVVSARLKPNGYEVAFARDGVSCMKTIREESPDLILLDLNMPAGDGFVILQRLQDQPDLTDAPVVVLSARQDAESRARAEQLGAAAYLQKPVDRDDLLATVWRYAEAPAHATA